MRPSKTCPSCGGSRSSRSRVCIKCRTKWPLQPLLDTTGVSVNEMARVVHQSGGNVYRALREGLSDSMADRWACALGRHPAEVWDGWFDAVVMEAS